MKTMAQAVLLLLVCAVAQLLAVTALNNGVARTPPMGWLSWERMRCETDCTLYPDTCISEGLYMAMADELVSSGFQSLGYEYVNIDDCWANHSRAADGSLQADSNRFPHGIKYLADYMHSRGLKLGIYGDIGTHTCGGYPGTGGHFKQDAETFASWGVDSLKLDGCYANGKDFGTLYPQMGAALNATGRHILYSCSWPAYIQGSANFTDIAKYCNDWRAYDDIQDSWDSVTGIIGWWAKMQDQLVPAAGPGAWNDPDQLIIGDFGLSPTQAKTQFSLWAMWAAPMLMSNDLRKLGDEYKSILQNSEVIAVNQDPAGHQAKQVASSGDTTWWTRMLSNGSTAVCIFYNSSAGSATAITTTFASIGFGSSSATVHDLWGEVKDFTATGSFTMRVDPHGVAMVTLSPTNRRENLGNY